MTDTIQSITDWHALARQDGSQCRASELLPLALKWLFALAAAELHRIVWGARLGGGVQAADGIAEPRLRHAQLSAAALAH